MLGKEDVDRIIEEAMKNLSIEVGAVDWINPNVRTIVLKYNNIEISRTSIDIKNRPEYEG